MKQVTVARVELPGVAPVIFKDDIIRTENGTIEMWDFETGLNAVYVLPVGSTTRFYKENVDSYVDG